MARDTIFRIASMTKPITSLAFMMLVEEGLVALDTPVHHVLPELKGVGVYAGGGVPFATKPTAQPMRMVDLLRHTSGLTYSFQNRTNVDAAYREGRIESWHGNLTLDEFVAALGKLPLEFSPGEEWNYSVSTDVLGAVVARISGVSLDRFFAERIFAPLGMHDTFFQVPENKVHRLADCWTMKEGEGRVLYDRGEASAWSRFPRLLSGGGGLVSTALDYHRFNTMLLNGGELDGARVVSRSTIKLMTSDHLGTRVAAPFQPGELLLGTPGYTFGLGFAVRQGDGVAGVSCARTVGMVRNQDVATSRATRSSARGRQFMCGVAVGVTDARRDRKFGGRGVASVTLEVTTIPVPYPAAAASSMIVGTSRSVPAVVPMRPALVTMPVAMAVAVFAESATYSGRLGFSSATV